MLIYVNVNLHKLSKNINSYFCRYYKIMECSFKKADNKQIKDIYLFLKKTLDLEGKPYDARQ